MPYGTQSVSMSGDPRAHKPRLPKSYTPQQLSFLKSNLAEFERRSQGSVRGDAKKFALERASDFIIQFGLPDEFLGMEESESRFREQIYNWFKNTIGRTRRKLEGRPRSSKKTPEKAVSSVSHTDLTWSANVSPPPIIPYPSVEVDSPVTVTTAQTAIIATTQYSSSLHPDGNISPSLPPTASPHHAIGISFDKPTLREGFLHGVDPSTLASMIQNFTISNPSPTPLTGVIDALFEAVSADSNTSFSRDPHVYLRRFYDASTYFSPSIAHAGVSGPLAGPRALQMQIRKYSIWNPNMPSGSARGNSTQSSSVTTSITDEMRRIACDRQRRKDHIQWARIHAAALELGMLGMGNMRDTDNNGYAYATGRMLSEMMARDVVWETDEVEWVAGICVLRALIRTAIRGDQRQRDDYDELLRTYEGRWKEIKDETRQALVADVLLAAKEDLSRLDDSMS